MKSVYGRSSSCILTRAVGVIALALTPAIVGAQANPSANSGSSYVNKGYTGSKWDIFVGYSYLAPHGTIPYTPPVSVNPLAPPPFPGSVQPAPGQPGSTYGQINWGGIGSISYYFRTRLGLELSGAAHSQSEDWPLGDNQASYNSNDDLSSLGIGPIFRFPTPRITPFVHLLFGVDRVGAVYQPEDWGFGFTAGGGVDINFGRHIAWRMFQADYKFTTLTSNDINSFQLSSGLLMHIGSITPPPPVTLACSASPESVYPGDPSSVTATAGSLNPKDHVIYSWSGTGISGTDPTEKIDTASLAPGQYTYTGTVKEGKSGKEGLKPWQTANCTAGLTVKPFEPPTISCSANPSTIKPGDTATVTSVGVSPQNRPLTYKYSATAGTVTGDGTTVHYDSAGAPTGSVGITCYVSDDKGQTASSQANLTIEAPYVPPAPKTQSLCTISFATDKKRPMRVDNEAKACLDQVALDLKQQTDAKAVLVGEQTADEAAKTKQQFAAQRAVNAKDYLVTEQGIDPSRISVATGSTEGQTVENYLVPSGANFTSDVTGTNPVDETAIKPQARKPLPQRHR
jgi:outer membrane protein OmpA-like peptidoglycan-associated protein